MSSYLITVMSSYLITVMSSYLITVAHNCCSSSLACAINRCAHMMLGAEQYFVRKLIFIINYSFFNRPKTTEQPAIVYHISGCSENKFHRNVSYGSFE